MQLTAKEPVATLPEYDQQIRKSIKGIATGHRINQGEPS